MERISYFVRRLLLMVPTFFGITVFCFVLCQFVPGGPVEQLMMQMRGVGGAGGGGDMGGGAITPELREAIKARFHLNEPIHVRYKIWLVDDRMGMAAKSWKYSNRTVWELIRDRFPVSLTFGITGFLLTYLVCIPLGIAKALRNGTVFDAGTSVLVFVLYAIPAFAFGMILKMLLCGTTDAFWNIFPLGGFRSEGWEQFTFWAKVRDQAHHMFLPVLCYMIGNFAVLTLLMKNSLLDQIGQDYVRTVLAKGGTMKRAIWGHAVRNAIVPIATGIGGILSIMFAGSVLIEQVFEIRGIGLLSIDAIVARDYMVFMGIVALTSLLALLGRILSDFCYVLIDPRINFGKDV